MDNYCNSPSLAALLREYGIGVARTFHLNKKNGPDFVKKI
jgi:hypothetical protein